MSNNEKEVKSNTVAGRKQLAKQAVEATMSSSSKQRMFERIGRCRSIDDIQPTQGEKKDGIH